MTEAELLAYTYETGALKMRVKIADILGKTNPGLGLKVLEIPLPNFAEDLRPLQ